MDLINYLSQHSLLDEMPKLIYTGILAYLFFKILDFITGLLKTWKGVTPYKSAVMRDGIIRWIGELVGITFVIVLDLILGLNYYLTGFTVSLFVYKEGGSIAENLTALGVQMPGITADILNRLNERKEDNNERNKTM